MKNELAGGIRRAAMNLLARREHSAGELTKKLIRRFGECEEIGQVLTDLASENLQSDRRFVESFVRWRKSRGQGPLRIAADLRQRSVDEELCDEYLDQNDPCWLSAARSLRIRRFGDVSPADKRSWARQARFLQQRGFTGVQVRKAFENFVA